MRALLADLRKRADMVIVDSPPLLPVTDAAVLAPEVDGVLLVLEAGRTRRGAARRALDALEQVKANVLGVVLNAVPQGRGLYYKYYYYYYDRGYYEDGKKTVRRRRHSGPLASFRRLLTGKPYRHRSRSHSAPAQELPAQPPAPKVAEP
jgi:Mrp family chromosome partitioning ATPase